MPEKLSQAEVAERLGITPRQVRRLHDRGLPREPDMAYSWPAVFSWFLDYKIEEAVERRLGDEGVDYEAARARREYWRAQQAELDFKERESRLVTKEVFDQVVGEMLANLNRAIRNIPGRWSPQLTHLESPREVEGVLRELVQELLEHLSGPAADEIGSGEEGLPEDFPGRAALLDAGFESVQEVARMDDLQEVYGIGPATEREILERLEAPFDAA